MLLLHLSLLTCLLATIARSDLVPSSIHPYKSHSNESHSKSVPILSAEAANLLSQQLSEISAKHHQHHKVKKSVPNQLLNLTTVESSESNLTGDSAVLKSLKSLISTSKKKPINPGIVYQNQQHERVNDEEISDDLTKFEGYSKLLSQLMHTIVNKDLGLSVMQQKVDKLTVDSSSLKFESILESITDKVCYFSLNVDDKQLTMLMFFTDSGKD